MQQKGERDYMAISRLEGFNEKKYASYTGADRESMCLPAAMLRGR